MYSLWFELYSKLYGKPFISVGDNSNHYFLYVFNTYSTYSLLINRLFECISYKISYNFNQNLIISEESPEYNSDINFHIQSVVFLFISVILLISCLLMIRALDLTTLPNNKRHKISTKRNAKVVKNKIILT